MKLKIMTIATLLVGFATMTEANNIMLDVRNDQMTMIKEGRQDGHINAKEGAKLLQEQARIENAIQKVERDGVITEREKSKIARLQKRAEININTALTNRYDDRFYKNSNVRDRYYTGAGGCGGVITPTRVITRKSTPRTSKQVVRNKPVRKN